MIERRTVLDRVELNRSGDIAIRVGLLLVEDEQELDSKWHRTTIPADVAVADHFVHINQHLVAKNFPVIGAAVINRISQIAAIVRQ